MSIRFASAKKTSGGESSLLVAVYQLPQIFSPLHPNRSRTKQSTGQTGTGNRLENQIGFIRGNPSGH
jgi:hypothetical protein